MRRASYIFVAACLVVANVVPASAQGSLSISTDSTDVIVGESFPITVDLSVQDGTAPGALQMDLEFASSSPLSFGDSQFVPSAAVEGFATDNFTKVDDLGNSTLRVSLALLGPGTGMDLNAQTTIGTLNITLADADGPVTVTPVAIAFDEFGADSGVTLGGGFEVTAGPGIEPEDINGDGNFNLDDIQDLFNNFVSGNPNPRNDVNGDGSFTLDDIQELFTRFVTGGRVMSHKMVTTAGSLASLEPLSTLGTRAISFNVSNSMPAQNETITVEMVIDDANGLDRLSMDLLYDPAVFTFVSAELTSVMDPFSLKAVAENATAGPNGEKRIRLTGFSFVGPISTGGGTVGIVQLQVNSGAANGATNLVYDPDTIDIQASSAAETVNITNSTVTVGATPDTPTPTETPTAVPTDTPTNTLVPTDTPTNTPLPTDTPTATETPTVGPTDTPTETPTVGPTDTPTETPTVGPTDTPTETPTDTPIPTDTPTESATDTPVPTDTPLPTDTPTVTETPTAGPTDTPTESATDTPVPTDTPIPTDTPTPTETTVPTDTPTFTPTPTPTLEIPLPEPPFSTSGFVPFAGLTDEVRFRNPETQVLSISVGDFGGALDPAFDLVAEDGTVIVSDDDSGIEDDAFAVLSVPAGVYTVVVRGGSEKNGQTAGEFSLNVIPAAVEAGMATIDFGQQLIGNIDAQNQLVDYALWANQGDRIAISVSDSIALGVAGTALDPFVEIFGPNNFTLGEDDNSGPQDDAYLVIESAPTTGLYVIEVSHSPYVSGNAYGRFLISVEGNVRNDYAISLGERIEGMIASAGQIDTFTFANATGGEVWFVLDDFDPLFNAGSELDPYLSVLNTSGEVVGSDDNSGPADDAQLSTSLADGSVEVGGGNSLSQGTYGLSYVDAAPAAPDLANGAVQLDGSLRTKTFIFRGDAADPQIYETFTVTVAEGESWLVRFTDDGSALDPAFRISGPGINPQTVTGLPLGYRTKPNEDDAGFVVSNPGTYTIEAYGQNRSFGNGAMLLIEN